MPISDLRPRRNFYEKIIKYRIDQLKLMLHLDEKFYSLFALVIYRPPLLQGSIGHYIAAIKFDDEFVVFDDTSQKTYFLNKTDDFVIHCLFYKKVVHDDNADESSIFP